MTTPITPTNTTTLKHKMHQVLIEAYGDSRLQKEVQPIVVEQLMNLITTEIKAHNTQLVEAVEGMKLRANAYQGNEEHNGFNRGLEAVKKIIES